MRRILFAVVIAVSLLGSSSNTFADVKFNVRWEHATPLHLPQGLAVSRDGKYLFASIKNGGVAVLHAGASGSSRQVAVVLKAKLGNLDAMNVQLQDDRLYVALGGFFGRTSKAGVAIINVKDPTKPTVLGVWQSDEVIEGAAIVAVNGKHAYVGAMSHGVMTLDISDPAVIKHVSTVKPDIHFPRKDPGRIGKPNARGMTIRGKYMYLAYDAGGLRVMDISKPTQPREVSQYINKAMKNKQQAYNNVVVDGKYAYIAIDYAGLEIVDISNPRRVHPVGWWNPWKADTNHNLWFNSPGHTNELVLDAKGKLVFISAGDSELQVIDVSNPQRPKLAAGFGKTGNGLGVWGLTAAGNTVYLSYIKTFVPFKGKWSGIKAVELVR